MGLGICVSICSLGNSCIHQLENYHCALGKVDKLILLEEKTEEMLLTDQGIVIAAFGRS